MPCITETKQRRDGWWFTYLTDDNESGECGPYQTRAAAEDDARGVARFYRVELNRRLKRCKYGSLSDYGRPTAGCRGSLE